MNDAAIDRAAFDATREMVGDDFIGELIDTFLEDAPRLLDELRAALARADAESFRRAAHSLKSNAASFGAAALSERAKALELRGRGARLDGAEPELDALGAEYARVDAALSELRHEYP